MAGRKFRIPWKIISNKQTLMKFRYYSHKKRYRTNIPFSKSKKYIPGGKNRRNSNQRILCWIFVAKKKKKGKPEGCRETGIRIATPYIRRKHNPTPRREHPVETWSRYALQLEREFSRGIFSRHAAGGGVTNRLCCTLCSIMIYLVKRRTGQRVSIRTVALDCEFRQFAFRPRPSSFSPYIKRERESRVHERARAEPLRNFTTRRHSSTLSYTSPLRSCNPKYSYVFARYFVRVTRSTSQRMAMND